MQHCFQGYGEPCWNATHHPSADNTPVTWDSQVIILTIFLSDYEPSLNFTALCDDEFQIERISLLTLVKEISSGNQSISFCKGLHMVPELSPNLFLERAQFAVTPYPCNCCLQSCFHSKALSHRVNSLQENFQAHIYLLLCVCDIAHSLKSSLIMKRPSVFS